MAEPMPSFADPATMKNHAVAQHAPSFSRKQGHEVFFDAQGVVALVKPKRVESRDTWVSTTTPTLMPKAFPRTTLAVLRATPGKRDQPPQVLEERHLDGPASAVALPGVKIWLCSDAIQWF